MTPQTILAIFFFFALINISSGKLIGLIQFIRHGARTPLDFFEAFKNDFLPFKKGELTKEGFTMAHEKGESMRNEYSNFKSSNSEIQGNFVDEIEKNQNLIKVFSSPIQRTILTSLAYLNGFFPKFQPNYEKGGEKINLDSLMQDRYSANNEKRFLDSDVVTTGQNKNLPVKVFDSNHQFVYKPRCLVVKNSNEIKKYKKIILSDEEYKFLLEFKSHYPNLFKEYCEYMKKRNPSFLYECPEIIYKKEIFLEKIAGALHSIDFHKKKNIDPELKKLSYVSYIKLHYETLNDEKAKVEGTNHMRYIKSFLSNINNCDSTDLSQTEISQINPDEVNKKIINSIEKEVHCRKYVLFSLHDDNLYAIIRSLFDVNEDINNLIEHYQDYTYEKIRDSLNFYWPPYISDISFQLHSYDDTNEEYVRIFYNGNEMKNMKYFKVDNKDISYTDKGILLGIFSNYLESRIANKIELLNKC